MQDDAMQCNAIQCNTIQQHNSSGADPKRHLKEISIQTLSHIHFKPVQLNSNSVEPQFQFPFQFNVESIRHVALMSMHFNTISSTFNSIQIVVKSN